jgi:hypothetical protein
MTGEAQTKETKTLPANGTVYSIPHPKAFTTQSYILLDTSADEVARTGPTLLELLGDKQTGKGFLKNVFATVSQLRNLNEPKQDFFAIFHSTTPQTNPNRVSQQAYFHGHVVVGDSDDKFIKAVRESRAYGQNKPSAKLDEAIRLHRYEGYAGKTSAHALAEVFEPWAEHRLAPFHRILTVNDGDLEETLGNDFTIEGIRKLLLFNIQEASARTGVRLAIDTFSDPDSNGRTGLVIHMLGDLNDEPVTDAKGKTSQRRWFEIPKP